MRLVHRCLLFAVVGVAWGFAANAWGQDAPVAGGVDPTTQALVDLVRGGGLPAVLGGLGIWIGRLTQGGIKLSVRLDSEDRQALVDALKRED